MNIWKLEWLRLVRTKRIVILLVVFVAFGLIGPLGARYLPELINNSPNNGGITVTVTAKPKPVDGYVQYMSNVSQLGTLVAVIIAAYSLAIDAKTNLSVYYRTRIKQVTKLILSRFVVITMATVGTFIIGTIAAWYETTALLGNISIKNLIVGALYISIYWIFSIATVALAASFVRGLLATVGLSLGMLISFPLLSVIKPISHWLPSELVGSLSALVGNQHTAAYYFRPTVITLCATVISLGIALWRFKVREIES